MTRSLKIAALAATALGAMAIAGCEAVPPSSTSRTVIYSDSGHDRNDHRRDRNDRNDRWDRDRDHRGDRGNRHDRDRDRDRNNGRQTACTMEYAPVCGRRGHDQRTFSNACQARASNYSVAHGGRC